MLIHTIARLLAVAVVTTGIARGATLPTPDPNWRTPQFNGSSPPTDAVSRNGWVFYAAGNYLYGRYASSGRPLATPHYTGGTIQNAPELVRLLDGRWYVFVASGDGRLYKFDVYDSIAAGSMQVAKTGGVPQIRDIRRVSSLTCAVQDTLSVSPVVQLAAQSGGDYRLRKDLVMVATHHGCGHTTTNKILAFDAADIRRPAVWIMNDGGEYSIDYWTSCLLDYTRNRIFCGTYRAPSANQNTLWSIDTTSGTLLWSAGPGALYTRAALGRSGAGTVDHLYVADATSRLHAFDPESGSEHWVLQLGRPELPITTDVSVGRNAYAGLIIATTSSGSIVAAFDNGANSGDGEVLWTNRFAARAITKGEVLSTSGKLYVGFDDGTVYQMNLATGSDEGYVTIDGGPPRTPGSVHKIALSSYRDRSGTKLVVSRSGLSTDPSGPNGSVTAQLVVSNP